MPTEYWQKALDEIKARKAQKAARCGKPKPLRIRIRNKRRTVRRPQIFEKEMNSHIDALKAEIKQHSRGCV